MFSDGIELDIGGLFSDLKDVEDDEFAQQEFDELFNADDDDDNDDECGSGDCSGHDSPYD